MTDFQAGDDIIDVRDIIARVEELREQQTDRFVAGSNMPGYMPDSDPAEFDNADDAKRSIIEDIKHAEDSADTEEEAETLAAFAEDVNLQSDEFSAQCGKYVYWVTKDGVMGLDEDEQKELATLESLLDDLKGHGGDEQWEGDWYPVTLIHENYFEESMDEMVADCYEIPKDLPSFMTITLDYDALKQDYTECEFEGETYYYR